MANRPERSEGFNGEETLSDAADLLRRIRESDGERISLQMQALEVTYFAFAVNCRDLLARIAEVENPSKRTELWDLNNRRVMKRFQKDIMRLLHNLLASAKTLIDHTRVIKNGLYQGKPFEAEYQIKIEDLFAKSELARFVMGLRNWMLHRGLLPVVARLSYASGSSATFVLLNLSQLKDWDGWDAAAKAYLARATDDLQVAEVIMSYAELVEAFYVWLEKRMLEMHGAALEELVRLERKLESWQELNAENNSHTGNAN